jgi:hypothetical protein
MAVLDVRIVADRFKLEPFACPSCHTELFIDRIRRTPEGDQAARILAGANHPTPVGWYAPGCDPLVRELERQVQILKFEIQKLRDAKPRWRR